MCRNGSGQQKKLLQSITVLFDQNCHCKVTVPQLETNDSTLQI